MFGRIMIKQTLLSLLATRVSADVEIQREKGRKVSSISIITEENERRNILQSLCMCVLLSGEITTLNQSS